MDIYSYSRWVNKSPLAPSRSLQQNHVVFEGLSPSIEPSSQPLGTVGPPGIHLGRQGA